MTLAIANTELDDLFDLDVDMVMPKLPTQQLSEPHTSASTCDSFGQTGHPCQCF